MRKALTSRQVLSHLHEHGYIIRVSALPASLTLAILASCRRTARCSRFTGEIWANGHATGELFRGAVDSEALPTNQVDRFNTPKYKLIKI
jgi:hypothetical protein